MKWTEAFIPTLKEDPQDAEVISHKLMVRGGFIRKLVSGAYSYLPLGLRVIEKIKKITNSSSEVAHLPERAGDVKHSMAAVDKLHATGFRPQNDFDQGLSATVEYFKSLKKVN